MAALAAITYWFWATALLYYLRFRAMPDWAILVHVVLCLAGIAVGYLMSCDVVHDMRRAKGRSPSYVERTGLTTWALWSTLSVKIGCATIVMLFIGISLIARLVSSIAEFPHD